MGRDGSEEKVGASGDRIAAKDTDLYSATEELVGRHAATVGPRYINQSRHCYQRNRRGSRFWRDLLGLENVHTEVVEEQKVRVAMLPIGESRIELLEPTSDDSPISKFLDKRGGGIHHVAVEVDDIEATLAKLKAGGARLIDESPRIGAEGCLVAFVHPASTGGVLLELVQTK